MHEKDMIKVIAEAHAIGLDTHMRNPHPRACPAGREELGELAEIWAEIFRKLDSEQEV